VRAVILLLTTGLALAACDTSQQTLGPDGRPLPKLYRISAAQASQIQFRALDTINALRQASGAGPLELNNSLNNAAAIHSRDMAQQARPWHFGSDGTSPLDRAARAGYSGQVKGEDISVTYETELETIAAWMQTPDTRQDMLDPSARHLGFSFYQEQTGKIWWTLVTGG
jgi:uncharacterized protein YkwD